MIVETSKDVLWLALAFAVILVSVFLSWMMYYVILMLRDIRMMVHDTRDRMNRIEQFVGGFVERAEGFFGLVPLVGEGMKTAIGYLLDRREEKRSKK